MPYSAEQYRQARLSRDARFDGQFFIAVKTTGIFCRPICPATPPKEENVQYFEDSLQALHSGYRPCLRCRPDSAPGSKAWQGIQTTVERAIKLLNAGELQDTSLDSLSERLGISSRYLRKLFQEHVGMSPKQYALFQQLLFAKQLLHHSAMPIADIAIASGFNSVRRFNDAFAKTLCLTPSDIRRSQIKITDKQKIRLAYRPPFDWQHMLDFYRVRAITAIETVTTTSYTRTVTLNGHQAWFCATQIDKHQLEIEFMLDDIRQLRPLILQIRRLFDLDADSYAIEQHLVNSGFPQLRSGLRIPGIWSTWEAGVRAILGQQISVTAAIKLLNLLVTTLSTKNDAGLVYFPLPTQVAQADLSFLKMPNSRRETLIRFAHFMADNPSAHPDDWLALKGIGPWTANYAKLRARSEPNCFLETDLVVKKTLLKHPSINADSLTPWGSYATFQCWNLQS